MSPQGASWAGVQVKKKKKYVSVNPFGGRGSVSLKIRSLLRFLLIVEIGGD